jgi:hypothetical protein
VPGEIHLARAGARGGQSGGAMDAHRRRPCAWVPSPRAIAAAGARPIEGRFLR